MPRREEVVHNPPNPPVVRGSSEGGGKIKAGFKETMTSRARDAVAEMIVDWLEVDGGEGPKWRAYRRFCEWYRQACPSESEAITNIALRQWVLSLASFLEAWEIAERLLAVRRFEKAYRQEGLKV